MDLNKIIEITSGIKVNAFKNNKIKHIVTDSRKIKKNDLFIALKGDKYNGHDFVNGIKKASGIVIEEDILITTKVPVIKVSSTMECLFKIGKYYRDNYNIPLIAITGSNGKTTTKELISYILEAKYHVLKNKENYNNLIGVSDTLYQLHNKHDIIVMEIGMNHFGEISKLSKMCSPDIGVITNIGSSHLEYLKTRKNIFKAKMELTEYLKGNLIVNGDDKYLKKIKNSFKCGRNYNNDLIAYNLYSNQDLLEFNIFLDKEYRVCFHNPGLHFVNDILLAIKVCLMFNIDIQTIIERINSFKMIDKRMNIIKKKDVTIIDDCYNANYESVKAGLETLKNNHQRKLIILGDMLELGKASFRYHYKLNFILNKISNKKVLTVGKYTKYIKGKHFDNNDALIDYLHNQEITNCVIYIKGSHGMHLDEITKWIMNNKRFKKKIY